MNAVGAAPAYMDVAAGPFSVRRQWEWRYNYGEGKYERVEMGAPAGGPLEDDTDRRSVSSSNIGGYELFLYDGQRLMERLQDALQVNARDKRILESVGALAFPFPADEGERRAVAADS